MEVAMTAATPGSSGREVFTLDRGFRRPLMQRGALALVLAGLAALVGTVLGTPMFIVAVLCGLAAAGFAVAYAWQGRFRTVLTPEGVSVRGYLSHFVPWSAVAGFAVRRHGAASSLPDGGGESSALSTDLYPPSMRGLGGRRRTGPSPLLITVQVVRTNGHRLTLRAPAVTGWQSDADFDDKVTLMEQWRRQYGPPPLAAPRA
jgi:hypothetical protein